MFPLYAVAYLNQQSQDPPGETNDSTPPGETNDSTPSATNWLSHARRHKQKGTGIFMFHE